jgi:SAM-dependent methyltransferase
MDVVISIAVIHHLSTPEVRRKFLEEFKRVYNGKGGAMITAWSYEAVEPSWEPLDQKGDYLVPWNYNLDGTIYKRYYHVFDKDEILDLVSAVLPVSLICLERGNWYVYIE